MSTFDTQRKSPIQGIQFLVDESGQRTAVLINLKKNPQLWEDFCDLAHAKSREKEPRESPGSIRRRLRTIAS